MYILFFEDKVKMFYSGNDTNVKLLTEDINNCLNILTAIYNCICSLLSTVCACSSYELFYMYHLCQHTLYETLQGVTRTHFKTFIVVNYDCDLQYVFFFQSSRNTVSCTFLIN